MRALVLIAALALAGCGVDGEPVPKTDGVSVSGTTKIGVSGTL
jgi:hypothetical protein